MSVRTAVCPRITYKAGFEPAYPDPELAEGPNGE